MLNSAHDKRALQVVVITVCVGSADVSSITGVAHRMPWNVSEFHLDAYVSKLRRPAFGPQVRAANAAIALISFDKEPEEAAETARYLSETYGSKISIIATASSRDPDLILLAVRAGCNEFLPTNPTEAALSETLNRLEHQWRSIPERSTPNGAILAFFGVKGGVGTTTLTVQLASYLVTRHGKRVLLIDGHEELGHCCVYLGLDGGHYLFSEVVRNVSRLDSELLHGFTAKHPSGLEVLSSPDTSGDRFVMDPDSIARTLDFLRSEYDYVLVDCDRSFSIGNGVVFSAASSVYVVATPGVGAIRDLSRIIDRLNRREDLIDKSHIVLNRYASPFAINAEEIERAIGLPIDLKIANNYPEMMRAENLGEPVPFDAKSELSQGFARWAESLAGTPRKTASEKKNGGLRSFLTGKSLVSQM